MFSPVFQETKFVYRHHIYFLLGSLGVLCWQYWFVDFVGVLFHTTSKRMASFNKYFFVSFHNCVFFLWCFHYKIRTLCSTSLEPNLTKLFQEPYDLCFDCACNFYKFVFKLLKLLWRIWWNIFSTVPSISRLLIISSSNFVWFFKASAIWLFVKLIFIISHFLWTLILKSRVFFEIYVVNCRSLQSFQRGTTILC